MSKTTTNLGLIKPELTDPSDITQTNQNWDIIDEKLSKAYSDENKPTPSQLGAAQTDHSSEYSVYGVAKDTKYGHVRLSDEPDEGVDVNRGYAVTPHALYVAVNEINGALNNKSEVGHSHGNYAPLNHSTPATTYGLGTATNFGHVQLSNAVDSELGAENGIAATPKAVKEAYNLAKSKAPAYSYGTTELTPGSSALETGKLYFVYE